MKNKKASLILGILLVVFIIIGVTYAYYEYQFESTIVYFTVPDDGEGDGGIYSCSADGGGNITSNDVSLVPTSCMNSDYAIKREVKVMPTLNKDDLTVSLNLWLDIKDIGQGLSDSVNFKYALTNSENSCTDGVISEGNFNGKVKDDKIILLNEKEYKSTIVDTYYLYIWLDEEESSTSTMNQSFDLSLGGSCSGFYPANKPVLDEGMIPVTISDDGTVTTIDENDSNWYDYKNKKWANMVLVNENATDGVSGSQSRSYYKNNIGVTVNSSDILAYYVWIPRYKYKLWTTDASTTTQPQEIYIQFESADSGYSNENEVGKYITHPAFWWDVNSDGTKTENEILPGIWVGKFETTGTGDKPTVLPNTTSLANQNVSTQFQTSLKFAGGLMNTSTGDVSFNSNNAYGLTINTDSHMMKNSEWGAVAYLSHSNYGINDEVRINNYYNEGTLTGCGALTSDEAESTTCGIPYGGALEYPQSTTGNITGVYDMSGGSWEYVMGNYNSTAVSSGFNIFPKQKYYDLYNVTSNSECTLEICGGHALYETAGWYSDQFFLVDNEWSWFWRGGTSVDTNIGGIFYTGTYTGDGNVNRSFRSILIPVETYEVTYDYQNNIYNMNTSSWVYDGDNSKVNNNYSYNGTTGVEVYSDDVLYTGFWIPLNNDKKINTNYRLSLKAYRTNDFDGYLRAYSTTTDLSNNLLSYNHGISINNDNLSKNQWKEYSYSFNSLDYGYWDGISIDYDTVNQGPIYVSDIRLDEYTSLNINYGDNYELPSNPTRTGYTFKGWYTEPNGQGIQITDDTIMNLKENHTLYAHWEVNTYKISYSLNNLITGLDDVGVTQSGYMNYSINNGVVTVTASYDDGYGFINGRVYLEAGKTYVFSANTSGLWVSESGADTVEAYLMLNGEYNTYYHMAGNSNYSFTPQVSGEYWLRLDVNQSGKTHTFSNINISRYEDINVTYGDNYELPSNPTRAGYTFLGWNTKADGSGTTITSNSIFSDVSVQTVYAIWQKNEWTISYDANGGSGVPGNQVKTYGETLTLSSTVPTRTGYTFLGWSTDSNATSATYSAGGSYTDNKAVTLYAVWKINTWTVSYNANGGSGAPSNQTKTYGQTLTLSSTKPTRTGYTFLGWSTSSSATSATYSAGGSYTANEGATLYAVWKINTWTVSYNANGGSGAPSNQTKTYNQTLTLSSTKPTRTGYTFLGWSTSSSATSATYSSGGSYTANEGATLYAVWKINTWTVSYNANGGSGAPSNQTKTYGQTLTLSSTKPTRTGYTFLGWSTSSSATSATYSAGGSYTANEGATLYAVWISSKVNVTFNVNGGVNMEYNTPGQYVYDVSMDGVYKLEVWGAQGGGNGGYGAYSTGTIELTKNQKLYVTVGGQGGKNAGGYNGGGTGQNIAGSSTAAAYGGGGATHVALSSGLLKDLSSKVNDILIVAGGGGGGGENGSMGGSGGGINGNSGSGSCYIATGGTQTSGGSPGDSDATAGGFGYGGNAPNGSSASGTYGAGGGGSGYYGGGGNSFTSRSNCAGGGAGGSGYIGNSLLTNKSMYCYNCTTSSNTNTLTYTTTSVSSTSTSNYTKQGNGAVKIVFVSSKKTYNTGSAYGDLPTPTRTGYQFVGWNTKADGSGTYVSSETIVSISSDHTLYAQWNVYSTLYLYNSGNEYSNVTGGWNKLSDSNTSYWRDGTVSKNSDSVSLSASTTSKTSGRFAGIITNNPIDLTYYSKLYINVLSRGAGTYGYTFFRVFPAHSFDNAVANLSVSNTGVSYIDISGISGLYYIGVSASAESESSASLKFDQIYLK